MTNNEKARLFTVLQDRMNCDGMKALGTVKRLRHCTAYKIYTPEEYVVLVSYDTVVALYDVHEKIIVERGRYSMTTYQHVGKFRYDMWEEYMPTDKPWEIKRINLEQVNWFKN